MECKQERCSVNALQFEVHTVNRCIFCTKENTANHSFTDKYYALYSVHGDFTTHLKCQITREMPVAILANSLLHLPCCQIDGLRSEKVA